VNFSGNAVVVGNGAVNWTCSRTSDSADGNISFVVTASAGDNYNSSNRHLSYTGVTNSLMRYALSTNTSAIWGDPTTVFGSTPHILTNIFNPVGGNTSSGSVLFTFSLAAGLNPIGGVMYSDTISIDGTCSTTKDTLCSVTPAPLIISVNVLASCNLSTQPPTMSLNYTSFQAFSAESSVPFTATCTNTTPYRMNISPSAGTMLGLPYSIMVGTSAGSPSDISSSMHYDLTGTGFAQIYYINGSISAGLAGTCPTSWCSASMPHILNIEY
jgi:hypothetical protein